MGGLIHSEDEADSGFKRLYPRITFNDITSLIGRGIELEDTPRNCHVNCQAIYNIEELIEAKSEFIENPHRAATIIHFTRCIVDFKEATAELNDKLKSNGIDIKFAVYPLIAKSIVEDETVECAEEYIGYGLVARIPEKIESMKLITYVAGVCKSLAIRLSEIYWHFNSLDKESHISTKMGLISKEKASKDILEEATSVDFQLEEELNIYVSRLSELVKGAQNGA